MTDKEMLKCLLRLLMDLFEYLQADARAKEFGDYIDWENFEKLQ